MYNIKFVDYVPRPEPVKSDYIVGAHHTGGFKYLQAVREVLTKRDNLPDYRLPDVLGLESEYMYMELEK